MLFKFPIKFSPLSFNFAFKLLSSSSVAAAAAATTVIKFKLTSLVDTMSVRIIGAGVVVGTASALL